MTDIEIDEQLYLSQVDGIYVNCSKLLQHQIEALRFLYAQFKKKNAGVILNDPSGYGKTVVVVLFLQAVKKLLQAPALVLCRAVELQHWRHHFHTWSTTDDVIFESSNPFVKKSVFVNSRQQLASLARRTWSVVVVDDELPRELQADYKIYLASEDMKENLFTFSSIYKWLFPKEEFDIKMFTANKNDPLDVDRKSVMVDFIFEPVVFRSRRVTPAPFTKPEIKETRLAIEPPRISRKNKDATGTKIKRSKARIEAENHAAKVPRIEPAERNSTITSKDYYKDKEMDVESFIRNEKPITGEGVEEFLDLQAIRPELDNTVHDVSSDNLNGDAVKECADDYCTADYKIAINDIVNNENDSKKENDADINYKDGNTGMDVNDVVSNENDSKMENDAVINDKDGNTGMDNSKDNVGNEKGDTEISVNNKNVGSVLDDKVETINDVVNNGSKRDLDAKITELEEKTLKKFKGSLLDSIF